MDPLTLALTVGGGLLSAGGSIADRLRARRESRRAIADLEPYTDPLQGFAQSRGILEAMNQMGTGNLAQLAARMGGSQGAAQAAGAEMGSQALSNAYLGALETGRQRAFQAQAMQNQARDTQSLLGGAMRDIGGVALDVGIRRMMDGQRAQNMASAYGNQSAALMDTPVAPTDVIPEADTLNLQMLGMPGTEGIFMGAPLQNIPVGTSVPQSMPEPLPAPSRVGMMPNVPMLRDFTAPAIPNRMLPIAGGGGYGLPSNGPSQRVAGAPVLSPITMRRSMSMLDPRMGQVGPTMAQTGMLGALAGTSRYQGMGLGQIPLRTPSPVPSSFPIQNLIGFDPSAYFPQMMR